METQAQEWTDADELSYRHLSGRAFATLDEHAETNLMKARTAIEKRLGKLGYDADLTKRNQVKRFLLTFADCEMSYKAAAKKVGISLTDLHTEFTLWPEGKMVRDYIVEVKKELTRLQDIEDLKLARQTMRDCMKDAKSGGDAKAAMYMLGKLDRAQFSEAALQGESGKGGKAQVVYNLPNLTVNMISAPNAKPIPVVTVDEEQPVLNM